ncbi:MAG: 16S rRNA (guanine(527)-N(7))-methyltransferase RsmG [Deltaproteobacteria bacterium]|nr:MAG: 16S rRNA (guanine(527)-N(7))-methyltransferase RsmG [Deltaproteobacteria bacterium]
MLTADIEKFLAQGLNIMGLSLDNQPQALSRLSHYFQELKKWNRKVNLVARTLDDKEILENHFLDSLTLLSLLPQESLKQEILLDVGTGAGFPGLVLKAACPTLSVTLVEPRKNRFYFLKHIARVLNLKGLEVLDISLEEKVKAKELSTRRFSFITSRAFTDILGFIKIAYPYLEKDGRIVLMKGPGIVNEMNNLGQIEMDGNFFETESKTLTLPFAKKKRWLVSIKGPDEKL